MSATNQPLPLSTGPNGRLAKIQSYFDAGNYPAMYSYIAAEMKAGRIVGASDDQIYWFEQAAMINASDSSSPASVFIRAATVESLILSKQEPTKANIDKISNSIARKVGEDILRNGEIPTFDTQLSADIRAALVEGKMTIGGWGGAFYYWNQEWTNPDTGQTQTVGQ